jgi:predicted acetyltransferase
MALPKAKKLGLSRVLITCDDDNIGSQKIIESNGGRLQDTILEKPGKLTRRYWINLE